MDFPIFRRKIYSKIGNTLRYRVGGVMENTRLS